MKHLKTLLFGLLWLAIACEAKANNNKPVDIHLHGYVTDAITKKPVSGVVVSATAPGIIGATEATTDADGYFSFGQLPAQQVNLQFGKKGYQNYKKTNVSVKEKTPVKLFVEFVPENKDEDSDETEYPILRMLQFS
jgi:hypothetical protein